MGLKQLFEFNDNNYSFKLNKKLFDYKLNKSRKTNSPYLNKNSSLLRLNIPFIFNNIKFNITNISDLKFNTRELNLLLKLNKNKFIRIQRIKKKVKKLIFFKKTLNLGSNNILKLYNLRKNILFNSNKQFKNISFNKKVFNNINDLRINYISSYHLFLNYNLTNQYLNYDNYYLMRNKNYNIFKINQYFRISS